MSHQPNQPILYPPNKPRSPGDLARRVFEYVGALIRIVAALLLAAAALATAYVAVRAMLVGIRLCTSALGL